MTTYQNLIAIKAAHTLIWVFFNVVFGYLIYSVIIDQIDLLAWVCVGLFVAEIFVLLAFRMTCPLTLLARRYSGSTASNFDIFLPEWFARNNQLIYGIGLAVLICGLLYRLYS